MEKPKLNFQDQLIAEDQEALRKEGKLRAPKVGDRVIVVIPEGVLREQSRPAEVLEVREEGRVIDAQVVGDFTGADGKPAPLIIRNAPYVGEERLKVKLRTNTWRWPGKEAKAD